MRTTGVGGGRDLQQGQRLEQELGRDGAQKLEGVGWGRGIWEAKNRAG